MASRDNAMNIHRTTQTLRTAVLIAGRAARYLKLEKTSRAPGPLLLRRTEVYGEE